MSLPSIVRLAWQMPLLLALTSCSVSGDGLAPALPDERLALAAPPAAHSAAQAEDDRIFRETRRLVGTPRWTLATSDADLHPAAFLSHYSCAVGFTLDLAKAPHLARIMTIIAKAETPRTSEEKHYWKRARPFIGNDAPICVARSPELSKSPSYPSGHTIAGYSTTLVLSALMPERAAPILQRGRVIGESRIVCGVHWASDVAAGYQAAGAFAVALLEDPSLRALMPQARQELRKMAAESSPPDPALCALEADAAAHSPFNQP